MVKTNELPLSTAKTLGVFSPYDGAKVGEISITPADSIDAVLQIARAGAKTARELSRGQRAEILTGAAHYLEQRAEKIAETITAEAGKTIRQARKEVRRAVNTMHLSAVEAKGNAGEVIPFDAYAGSENRTGWFSREPLGIIAAITPFNDPLNLVAHKIGPAIAGGNSVILKPSTLTPLSAQLLVDALVHSGLPPEVITVVHGNRDLATAIVCSKDVRMVSFTGGFRTGEAIARTAGLKKLSMDLGGNAPNLVLGDADIDEAVASCVSGAFWAAGQNCIGVQRILVEETVYGEFQQKFVEATAELVAGDPIHEATDVGPMISEAALDEVKCKIASAIEGGARLLIGGSSIGNILEPTVLENVPLEGNLWCEEVFAPVVMLQPVNSLEEALDLANAIDFSLHAGVFTGSIKSAMKAAERLEAGGVMVNDSSDYRFDAMPFGGSKYGSMGREGVRFAYEEMTQPKVICIRN